MQKSFLQNASLPDSYHFLLEPILPESPCGEDLEYDPQYMDLFIRIIPKEKKVIGGTAGSERLESEFEPIRWAEVEQDCLKLLVRSKDIRLLMVFLRSRVQQAQAAGLCQGLYLLEHTLRHWPEQVYPLLTTEGEADPLPRSDALMSLTENQGLLADIRRLSLNGSGGLRLEVREVERSHSLPLPEGALPPEAMRHRLEELASRRPADYCALMDALGLVRSVEDMAHAQLGAEAPDLSPLISLLARLEVRPTQYETQEESGLPGSESTGATSVWIAQGAETTAEAGSDCSAAIPQSPTDMLQAASSGTTQNFTTTGQSAPRIPNRHVAREQIRDIRLWFEENEPSSPVSLLLRQAEQMIGKRFSDLVHSLPDELLQKWEGED